MSGARKGEDSVRAAREHVERTRKRLADGRQSIERMQQSIEDTNRHIESISQWIDETERALGEMRVESRSLFRRQRALEIVGHELDELLAGQILHALSV